jgi:hypothetical protein
MEMTASDLELFAYHISTIYRQTGTFGLSFGDAHVKVQIDPSALSKEQGSVWDSVFLDGHGPWNRSGAAAAYARKVAGVEAWWRELPRATSIPSAT